MRTRRTVLLSALLATTAGTALAQPTIPAEFDEPGRLLDRLFTVGGVASLQVSASSQPVYAQGSMQVDIGFVPGGFFNFSTAGIGVLDVGSGFRVDPNADTFSIAILAPNPLPGGLELEVILRDDDNADGVTDPGSDDEWESDPLDVMPGLNIYNIPLAAFTDLNPGVGNDAPDFASGPTGGMILTFVTSTSMPEGRIEVATRLLVDHIGVYDGEQALPTECIADTNGDGVLSPADFTGWVVAYNTQSPECDQNGDDACTPDDFTAWIRNYNAGC
ncbi:MAG: GC-type dockerin domain-anchored protein [Phycisphaerales bacterium]